MSESEEITKLKSEVARIRNHLVRHHQLIDSPFLKNYAPYKDLAKPTQDDFDAVLDDLRSKGASIDGDNAYKRDLCDVISAAVILGAQDINPPPSDHWGKQFWDIGRDHLNTVEELTNALKLTTENLRACQATIHLAGGFDPAYVDDAQAAMAVARAALAKIGM